jgi:hypothetical protein
LRQSRGDIHRGEIPRAHQARERHGITPVGFHAVAGVLRHARGGDDSTVITVFAQMLVEPIAAWPGFIDENAMGSLGLACADAVLDVGLPRPDGAEVGDLSTVVLRDRRDRDRVLMDIPADGERARLVHG